MWFGVMALTISQFFLAALAWWGVDFFKQTHGLSASQAGVWSVLVGAGSGVGLVAGGHIADRLLRRGVLNARVYVVAAASVLATVASLPALLLPNLALSGGFFFLGVLLPRRSPRPRPSSPTWWSPSSGAGRRRRGRSCAASPVCRPG